MGANFKAFHLAGFNPGIAGTDRLAAATQAVLAASGAETWWSDDTSGARYGFVKCVSLPGGRVFGAIAQQHSMDQHLYSDAKEEITNRIESFEDRLFLLDIPQQLVAVEWRKFIRRPPLTPSLLLTRLREMLSQATAQALGVPRIDLVEMTRTTEKTEFIRLFMEQRALELEVIAPGSVRVDAAIQLVNPNPDLEGAVRDLMIHDFERNSLDFVKLEAKDGTGGDLRRSAFARSALHSGQPVALKYERAADGVGVTRRQKEDGIARLSISISAPASEEEILAIGITVAEALAAIDLPALPSRSRASDDTFNLFDQP